MSEDLSDEAVRVFAELAGIAEDDVRFEAVSELIVRYGKQSEALLSTGLPNSLAPLLTYQPPAPTRSGSVTYVTEPGTEASAPESDDDLAFSSILELAGLIRSRQVSPVELTELYLERLEKTGRDLNSVVTLTDELAMEQAEQAEKEIARRSFRSVLHGIPWGAKDLLATRGIPTTWGATPYMERVIDEDAAVVVSLREAGAVLAAKLSMGSLASGPHWFGGMTRNPWDRDSGSSGSSAGPGAATAAGLIGFSIGTETHGSITSPSKTCGVTGLRPTFGRVSRHGAMALGFSLDKIGPMCRSAEDCAAVFAAIAGRDERDPVTREAAFRWPSNRTEKLRLGFVRTEFEDVDEQESTIYDAAMEEFRQVGAELEPVELPELSPGLMLTPWVEAAAALSDLGDPDVVDSLKQDNSRWPEMIRAARSIPAVAYVQAQRLRSKLLDDFCSTMEPYDALLCPGTGDKSLTIGNMTGHPSLTIPVGFDDGLPQSLTMIGKHWDEEVLLEIGHAFQLRTDWHLLRPPAEA